MQSRAPTPTRARLVRAVSLVSALLGMLAPEAPARAQSAAALDIVWEAPPGCPQEDAIRAAVQRWLEQSPDPVDPALVSVDGYIHSDAQGFVLDLALESASGQSQELLRAEHCDTLADVVALKVMLAAAPSSSASQAAPARARPRRPREARSRPGQRRPEPAAVVIEPPPEGAGRRPDLALQLEAGASAGLLPGAAPFTGLSVSLQFSRFRIGLGAVFHPSRRQVYPNLPETGADLLALTGRADACFALAPRPLELALCGRFELGLLRGTGVGVSESKSPDLIWSAIGAGPSLRVPLASSLSLAIEAAVFAGLNRPSYHVKDQDARSLGELYQPSLWGGRAGIGLELLL